MKVHLLIVAIPEQVLYHHNYSHAIFAVMVVENQLDVSALTADDT